MSTARALLGILGGTATGYIIAVAITGLATPRSIGVAVAIIAASVIGIYLVKAIESDRRREADKARHPSARGPFDLKPWPVGDDEVRS